MGVSFFRLGMTSTIHNLYVNAFPGMSAADATEEKPIAAAVASAQKNIVATIAVATITKFHMLPPVRLASFCKRPQLYHHAPLDYLGFLSR
jgi:hypothetical protein